MISWSKLRNHHKSQRKRRVNSNQKSTKSLIKRQCWTSYRIMSRISCSLIRWWSTKSRDSSKSYVKNHFRKDSKIIKAVEIRILKKFNRLLLILIVYNKILWLKKNLNNKRSFVIKMKTRIKRRSINKHPSKEMRIYQILLQRSLKFLDWMKAWIRQITRYQSPICPMVFLQKVTIQAKNDLVSQAKMTVSKSLLWI